MRIKQINIQNFRTLENITINFDRYFSSISGRNNAGKTSVIKSIRALFRGSNREFSIFDEDESISYSNNRTQWADEGAVIIFKYKLIAASSSDPGLHSFIKKIAEIDNLEDEINIDVEVQIKEKEEKKIRIYINDIEVGKFETGEIYQRLSSSNIVFFHNSTRGNSRLLYPYGASSFHEMILSKDEKDELKKEQERIKKKVKRFAQEHRGELSGLLGKLEEKYEVELTVFDGLFRNAIPLGINLKDKGLEIPLDDWGSGTQNRTHIIMNILSASRVKQQTNDENRITPIIIIEEPESFLHPSAQAEFGRVIRGLSRELEVQIIITTHSPYMLCQEMPESNILLDRKVFRKRLKETEVINVTSEKWMEPFSEILGLNDDSLTPWHDVLQASRDNAILVEGIIDKEYIEYISSLGIKGFEIPQDVEIIPYGGKDALKNSIMLKFVIEKFHRVFITFDLDANRELQKVMTQLSLKDKDDFIALGLNEDGKDCIEGLVPKAILSKVYSSNPDLVMKLTTNDNQKRKSAKNELKTKILEEFKNNADFTSADLKEFKPFYQSIKAAFKV